MPRAHLSRGTKGPTHDLSPAMPRARVHSCSGPIHLRPIPAHGSIPRAHGTHRCPRLNHADVTSLGITYPFRGSIEANSFPGSIHPEGRGRPIHAKAPPMPKAHTCPGTSLYRSRQCQGHIQAQGLAIPMAHPFPMGPSIPRALGGPSMHRPHPYQSSIPTAHRGHPY